MSRRSRTARFATTRTPTRQGGPPPRPEARRAEPPSRTRPVRLAIFAGLVLLVGGVAIGLVVTRLQGPGATDAAAIQVRASMGGFDPPALTVKAGQTVRVELTSMDTSMHSDGGGWHQFAIDALDIDWKVGPLSSQVFEFTAPGTAGTYDWYCDICCGGKENPSMQGKLTVTA
ncbi:MAG: cupredoxin domain-containing protein [Chloroflexi bacterium]|nr:cupredoxin domain-containing protein [Chloroflexota bacterium]